MSDGLKSHIRTLWPILLGYLSALLASYVASKLGIQLNGEIAFTLVGAVMSGLVYSLGRFLETRRWSWARRLGAFMLSLGLVPDKPTYPPPSA